MRRTAGARNVIAGAVRRQPRPGGSGDASPAAGGPSRRTLARPRSATSPVQPARDRTEPREPRHPPGATASRSHAPGRKPEQPGLKTRRRAGPAAIAAAVFHAFPVCGQKRGCAAAARPGRSYPAAARARRFQRRRRQPPGDRSGPDGDQSGEGTSADALRRPRIRGRRPHALAATRASPEGVAAGPPSEAFRRAPEPRLALSPATPFPPRGGASGRRRPGAGAGGAIPRRACAGRTGNRPARPAQARRPPPQRRSAERRHDRTGAQI